LVKIIQDLWILSEAGIVLFHRHFDERMDDQLFGGLLSALNSFAEEIARGGISNFEISDKRFYLKKKKKYLFVTNSSKTSKPKKVMEEFETIITSFFEIYPNDLLENWDGDIRLFSNFEKKIQESLEDTLNKFQKAFW